MTTEGEASIRQGVATAPDGEAGLLRLCLFGAPGDTGNLGVSALLHGTVAGLARHAPGSDLTVFDMHARGERTASEVVDGRARRYRVVGARATRRVHQHESLWNLAVSVRANVTRSPGAWALRRADAVLDLSGGDSFSDIYGSKRFRDVAFPKRIALSRGIPLLLLPQTYGPFRDPSARRQAGEIVRAARMAWARDPDSYGALRDLAGDGFDPERHRLGVDMAFQMPARPPASPLPDPVAMWLVDDRAAPVVGVNISGLLYFADDAATRFRVRLDYRELALALVRRLLDDSDARVVLVHHLVGTDGSEPDERAQRLLRARLSPGERERVALAPSGYGARETKWLISQLDWFCGSRMHATIAALSTGVPAAAIAYSMKTRGVFATCGQEASVADARDASPTEVLSAVWASFADRSSARTRLARALEDVRRQSERQMQEIVRACR